MRGVRVMVGLETGRGRGGSWNGRNEWIQSIECAGVRRAHGVAGWEWLLWYGTFLW